MSHLLRNGIARIVVPSVAWVIACTVTFGILYFTIAPVGDFFGANLEGLFVSLYPIGRVLNYQWFLFFCALSIIPSIALIWILRLSNWKRGRADILAAGGLTGLNAIVAMLSFAGEIYVAMLVYGILIGAFGGYTYWLAAGRPQVPYKQAV